MADGKGKVTGFWHAGVTVSDMDAALVFYRDGLGLEVDSDRRLEANEFSDHFYGREVGDLRIVFLRVPGSDATLELFEYEGVDGKSVASPPWNHGGGHFCLYVEDADALYARLVELGFGSLTGEVVTIPGGPEEGAKVAYLVDGDGYNVEIYQPAPKEG